MRPRRMRPAVIERDFRSQLFERSARPRGERLTKNFAVLGGAQFEPGNDLLIEISDD